MRLDYIDEDLAYFLGAIVARGMISRTEKITSIIISYPFRNLVSEGLTQSYTTPNELSLGLDKIVTRVKNLDFDVQKQVLDQECQLLVDIRAGSLEIRVLESHLGKSFTSYRMAHVPQTIFQSQEESIKKEFMRGYVDVAGSIRKSNLFIDGRHRVYIDVLNENWFLPIELCYLLQDHLGVPVQTITWGHPNIRDPDLVEYRAGRARAWAREHQIKVFADAFEPISFYIEYKASILKELAEYNRAKYRSSSSEYCIPPKLIDSKKSKHPGENDVQLPAKLKGRHFDSYWQICEAIGCPRCKQQKKLNNV